MSTARDTELQIPPALIEAARAKHPCEQTDEDWHQCDAVSCGRWYQTNRPVAIQLYSTAKLEGNDSASFTVAVYELRWACPACSGAVNGQDLGHMDAFHAPERNKHKHQAPCDWCRNLDLDACDKKQHDKNEWDNEDDTFDFKATGIRLPPNWVGGYRTRSTDLSTYKVYLMYCRHCGEVLQPDRPDRFLRHINARAKDGSARNCLVPELDYLLQHTAGSTRADARPPLDPSQPVVAAPELEEVFKFKPRNELAHIAAQLHWDMVKAISTDDAMREVILADVEDPLLRKRLKKYADEMMMCAEGDGDKPPRQKLQVKQKTGRSVTTRKRKSVSDAGTGAGTSSAPGAGASAGSPDGVGDKQPTDAGTGTPGAAGTAELKPEESQPQHVSIKEEGQGPSAAGKEEGAMDVDAPAPSSSGRLGPQAEDQTAPIQQQPLAGTKRIKVLDLGDDRRVDSRGGSKRKPTDSTVGGTLSAQGMPSLVSAPTGGSGAPGPSAGMAQGLQGGDLRSPRAGNSDDPQPATSGHADGDNNFQVLIDAAAKAAAVPSMLGSPGKAFASPAPLIFGGGSGSHKAKPRTNATGGLQPQQSLVNGMPAGFGAGVPAPPRERAPRNATKQIADLQSQVFEYEVRVRELQRLLDEEKAEKEDLRQVWQEDRKRAQEVPVLKMKLEAQATAHANELRKEKLEHTTQLEAQAAELQKERFQHQARLEAQAADHAYELKQQQVQMNKDRHLAEIMLRAKHHEELMHLRRKYGEKLDIDEQEQAKAQLLEKAAGTC